MPTSHFYQLDKLCEIIFTIEPNNTLDVGIGFGKFGLLTREYVDIWRDGKYKDFKRKIDGIEVFRPYINQVHRYVYNKIYIGDAQTIVKNLKKKYDLVLLIDVIEHFSKKEGITLLKNLTKISKYILISTPRKMGKQGSVYGNAHEAHKYQWKKNDFTAINETAFIRNAYSTICLMGAGSRPLIKNMNKARIRDWINYFILDKK